jgi:serine phosphatase RsbU (regulator of sigma subunit)/integral membrane sensor domain MASE1
MTSWRVTGRLFIVVFFAFAAGAVLSWESFGSTVGPSFFYPSGGVTAAAMILSRRALWPTIAAAVIAAEILVDSVYGNPLALSFAFAVSNVVEPIVGASIVLAWCGGRPDLRKRRDFIAFIAGACLAAPVVGGLIGGTASSVLNGLPWLSAVLTWWSGDALGVLVVATPILLWTTQSDIVRRRPWETAGILSLTAAVSVASFWTEAPPSMLVLPMLAWAAFRLDMLGAALAGAVAAFLANIMTTHGWGLFRSTNVGQETRVLLTQAFVATIVVVALLIAQEASARTRAVKGQATERLERMRLKTLSRLSQQLAATLTPNDIAQALEDQVLDEAGAQTLALGLVSPDGRKLEWVNVPGVAPHIVAEFAGGIALNRRTVVTDVVRFGNAIEIHTSAEYVGAYPETAHWLKDAGAESAVGWPLMSGDTTIGVLLLLWADPQPLNVAQRAYISAVSAMASRALVRVQIYSEEYARSTVLQAAVLPSTPADTSGLDVGVLYQPATGAQGLGGDWYDIMALPNRRTYLAVGDIVGHGLLAVEDMAQLRNAGRAFAHQGQSPAGLMADLNRFIADVGRAEFATMAAAVFDHDSNRLSYCSAGHPPPLLRRSESDEVIRLSDASGLVLGPFAESAYTEGAVQVRSGDVLVMYTDGLVEHHGHNVKAGIAYLEQVVSAWPPEALLDCAALADRVAPSPRSDDICLLVVRFAPDRAQLNA